QSNAQKVDLAEVVPAAIAPFRDDYRERFTISGSSLLLNEPAAGGLALALNELSTNAIKYGALSNSTGKVSITWHSEPDADGERVVFEWRESGGPPVVAPTHQGFGT